MRPKIFIIARSSSNKAGIEAFLKDIACDAWKSDAENDIAQIPEIAGRVCYMSFKRPRPGGNKAYIKHIKEVGHFSVLEHVSWTLAVTGVSRSLTHELVRHRVGVAISQQSQRYVDESESAVIEPDIVYCNQTTHELFEFAVKSAKLTYKKLVAELEKELGRPDASFEEKIEIRKKARQAARAVLPNATQTRLIWTVNARTARHFLTLRASRHADTEIRIFANMLYGVLMRECPELFDDFKMQMLPDGTFELSTDSVEV